MTKSDQRRDDVLGRMLRTPPARHKPIGKRQKHKAAALIEEIKRKPDKLGEMARELGQHGESIDDGTNDQGGNGGAKERP